MKKLILLIVVVFGFNLPAFANQIDDLKQKCEAGNVRSCNNLGFMYVKGKRVKQDYVKAVRFYQKACDLGNLASCNYLGNSYDKGKGVKQNDYDGRGKGVKQNDYDGRGSESCNNLRGELLNAKKEFLEKKRTYIKAKKSSQSIQRTNRRAGYYSRFKESNKNNPATIIAVIGETWTDLKLDEAEVAMYQADTYYEESKLAYDSNGCTSGGNTNYNHNY